MGNGIKERVLAPLAAFFCFFDPFPVAFVCVSIPPGRVAEFVGVGFFNAAMQDSVRVFLMAVSGLWMLVVFYGVVYALLNDFSTDFFVLLGVLGGLAFVLSS